MRRLHVLIACWCLSVTVAGAQQFASVCHAALPEGVTLLRDIPYVTGGGRSRTLDLYLPDNGKNMPVVVYIHGGAWCMGSKADYVPVRLALMGYAIASVNYRLSQEALFPAQIEDCKAAVRWLRLNSAKYSLDPSRFASWGSSSGGHLAALLGTTGDSAKFDVGENLNVSSRVQAVLDYFGPTDFLQMDACRLPDGRVHDTPDSAESMLIGGPILENRDKVEEANPISYVTKGDPPFLIFHGDHDRIVPYHESELLEAALKQMGVPSTLYIIKGGKHGGFQDPMVTELTTEFLSRYLNAAQAQSAAGRQQPSAGVRRTSG